MKRNTLDLISIVILIVIWVFSALFLSLGHNIDDKLLWHILFIPLIATFTFLLISFIQKHPQYINLPFRLNGEKKDRAIVCSQNLCAQINCLFILNCLAIELQPLIKFNTIYICLIFSAICIFLIIDGYRKISKIYHE